MYWLSSSYTGIFIIVNIVVPKHVDCSSLYGRLPLIDERRARVYKACKRVGVDTESAVEKGLLLIYNNYT